MREDHAPIGDSSIEFRDVSYRPSGATVLDAISHVFRGPGLCLIAGRSGSGKTSLLRLAGDLVQPSAGQVAWSGVDPADCRGPVKRAQVTLIQQDSEFIPGSPWDNLRFPFTFSAHSEKQFPEAEAKILARRLHLDSAMLDKSVDKLSGGERQRVSLIRALLLKPRILIADEPSASLDQIADEAVADLLSDYAREHLVIVVSHSTVFLGRADEVVLMQRGSIVRVASSVSADGFRDFLGEEARR